MRGGGGALLTCRFATGSLPGYLTSGEESVTVRSISSDSCLSI